MTDDTLPNELSEETSDEKPDRLFESLYSKIMEMSVSEKIKLATLGNKEARNLLIKEANKLVLAAVINSPKLSDDEAIAHAGNRNLSKEVPRLIMKKKEFMKNYGVKFALVQNPKTPVPDAMKLLSHLREKDLRSIAKSKNVPSLIARTAMRRLSSR